MRCNRKEISPPNHSVQDCYNIYYDLRLSILRVGLATDRERARSEVPQPPKAL